ncbi:MAG: hypothetical protein KGD73_07920, partial [Candidatus Lokiarchaeota archaeon]|nr:hypothetical protein [Candidatus Lokiarchaeota archaeon]
MNILNLIKKQRKLNILVFLYIITLVFSSFITVLNGFYANDTLSTMNLNSNSDDTFIYSINGKNYLATYNTAEDIEVIQKGINSQSKRSNYKSNLIIDGHGTGYVSPSSEDLKSLIGKISLLDVVKEDGQKYSASADLST